MSPIAVIAKGNFGYHPASGQYLVEGEQYTIDESAFSEALFELAEPDPANAKPAAFEADLEGGEN